MGMLFIILAMVGQNILALHMESKTKPKTRPSTTDQDWEWELLPGEIPREEWPRPAASQRTTSAPAPVTIIAQAIPAPIATQALPVAPPRKKAGKNRKKVVARNIPAPVVVTAPNVPAPIPIQAAPAPAPLPVVSPPAPAQPLPAVKRVANIGGSPMPARKKRPN